MKNKLLKIINLKGIIVLFAVFSFFNVWPQYVLLQSQVIVVNKNSTVEVKLLRRGGFVVSLNPIQN